jgi:hypothetical protein
MEALEKSWKRLLGLLLAALACFGLVRLTPKALYSLESPYFFVGARFFVKLAF